MYSIHMRIHFTVLSKFFIDLLLLFTYDNSDNYCYSLHFTNSLVKFIYFVLQLVIPDVFFYIYCKYENNYKNYEKYKILNYF